MLSTTQVSTSWSTVGGALIWARARLPPSSLIPPNANVAEPTAPSLSRSRRFMATPCLCGRAVTAICHRRLLGEGRADSPPTIDPMQPGLPGLGADLEPALEHALTPARRPALRSRATARCWH